MAKLGLVVKPPHLTKGEGGVPLKKKGGSIDVTKISPRQFAKTWREPSNTIKKRITHRHVSRKAGGCRSILDHPPIQQSQIYR